MTISTFDGMDADAIKIKIAAMQRVKKKKALDPTDIPCENLAADLYFPDDLPLFMCTNPDCNQIYWFSEGENSSAVRSKALAEELYDFIKNEFIADGTLSASCESAEVDLGVGPSFCETSVASSAYRSKLVARGAASIETPVSLPPVQCSASSESIEHSLRLQSPYASKPDSYLSDVSDDSGAGHDAISTVRDQFHGMIDHIFFSPQHLKCVRYEINPVQ